jgi:hypothetical protein
MAELEQPELISSPFNRNPYGDTKIPIDSLPGSNAYRTLGWCNEIEQESGTFIGSQKGYDRIEPAIESIIGVMSPIIQTRSPLSQTKTNRVADVAEQLAAILTDTKPFWDYETANKRWEQHAAIYGKLSTWWYTQRNIDQRMAAIIKYALVAGSGYGHLVWNPDIEDLELIPEDPRNVLPVRPRDYDSIQSCLGVIVKHWYPVNYFKDRFGLTVTAESDAAPEQVANDSGFIGGIASWLGQGNTNKAKPPRFPVSCLKILYLDDRRLNPTQSDVGLGEFEKGTRKPLNNWSYIVNPNQPLYPNKRMIAWVGKQMIYDGPSQYWHAMFPVLKFTISPWPWSYLGKAPIWDLLPLQDSLNSVLRVIDDHVAQVANPGSILDKNSVSRATFDQFDTRRPGWKAFQNPLAGKGIQIVNPPPMDAMVPAHRDWIQKEMREISGVNDLNQMLHLNQMPENSTVDAILNGMTPINRYRSRVIECFIREFATMLAYDFSQYYTLNIRTTIAGSGAVTQEDFDYDPESLIPAYTHTSDLDAHGSPLAEALARGPLPRYARAQEFLRRFTFKIAPGSFLNAAQIEDKMMAFQLFRAGVLDVFTLWEKMGIPNIGVLPDNVKTIPERLAYQAQIGIVPTVSAAGAKASGQQAPRQVIKES